MDDIEDGTLGMFVTGVRVASGDRVQDMKYLHKWAKYDSKHVPVEKVNRELLAAGFDWYQESHTIGVTVYFKRVGPAIHYAMVGHVPRRGEALPCPDLTTRARR